MRKNDSLSTKHSRGHVCALSKARETGGIHQTEWRHQGISTLYTHGLGPWFQFCYFNVVLSRNMSLSETFIKIAKIYKENQQVRVIFVCISLLWLSKRPLRYYRSAVCVKKCCLGVYAEYKSMSEYETILEVKILDLYSSIYGSYSGADVVSLIIHLLCCTCTLCLS